MNEVVYDGRHTPGIHGWLGPATGDAYDPGYIGQTFDPERVREELALAGLPDGFEFDASELADPVAITQAEFVQSQLAPFGIVMNIVTRPSPDYFSHFFAGEEGTFTSSMSVRASVWQQMAFINKDSGPFNIGLPENGVPEVEAAFTKVAETFEEPARTEALRELNRTITDLALQVHYVYFSSFAAADSSVTFDLFADGKPHFGRRDVVVRA